MAKSVAILGGGPSAAYAYRACVDFGIAVDVYAERLVRAATPGAFWLYWLPESAVCSKEDVYVVRLGDRAHYSRLEWGEDLPCSFPDQDYATTGYEPAQALLALWRGLGSFRQQKFASDADVATLTGNYDLVLQTFPTQAALASQPKTKEITVCCSSQRWTGQNLVVYNGLGGGWLRHSKLFGRQSTECPVCHPDCPARIGARLYTVRKLHPSTQPWDVSPAPNVHLIGRAATWQRRMLAHQCYSQTIDILSRLLGKSS